MASTTNFQEWIDMGNEPETHEDAYDLYHAAQGEGLGTYSTTHTGERMFIEGPSGDTLALVSLDAQRTFRKFIEQFKDDRDMDFESWIGFKRAIAKDD